MQKLTFELENKLIKEGYEVVVGIDEAGRGPLAGPIVACAVGLRNNQLPRCNNQDLNLRNWELIRDSKTLSYKQREKLFDFIHENFYVGVGICDHETIDRINILEASFLAMKKAINDLLRKSNFQSSISNFQSNTKNQNTKHKTQEAKYIILLDGNRPIPNFSREQRAIVNGDKLIKSISAASIIAKVTRDRIMLEMHEKYPQYDFAKHKGYGTKTHLERLAAHGPCEIHRKSFEPIRKLVKTRK